MAGVKGRSGRKRNIRNALKYFNELYDLNSYDLAQVTIDKALKGDREMLIYCHDRRMGRPKLEIDSKITGQVLITPDMRALAIREMIELKDDETKLLKEGNGQEGTGEDTEAETA